MNSLSFNEIVLLSNVFGAGLLLLTIEYLFLPTVRRGYLMRLSRLESRVSGEDCTIEAYEIFLALQRSADRLGYAELLYATWLTRPLWGKGLPPPGPIHGDEEIARGLDRAMAIYLLEMAIVSPALWVPVALDLYRAWKLSSDRFCVGNMQLVGNLRRVLIMAG